MRPARRPTSSWEAGFYSRNPSGRLQKNLFIILSLAGRGVPVKGETALVVTLLAKEYTFVVKFARTGAAGTDTKPPGYGESMGDTELYVNPDVNKDPVAQGPMKAQVGKFTLCGDGLCVGHNLHASP